MGPSELLRILRRRRLIIFLTIGLIVGLTALVLQTVTPLYRSEAIVIVESPEAPGDDPAATVAKARENEIRVITFLQLLQSRAMAGRRSEEHTSELQSLMRISYAVFCLNKKKKQNKHIQEQ